MNLLKWGLVLVAVAVLVRLVLRARQANSDTAIPTDDKGVLIAGADPSYFPNGLSEFSGAPIREWWDPRGWVGL